MRIAIDCRKIADYGIGTYIRGLLSGLAAADADHEYVLFGPESAESLIPRDSRFRLVTDDSPLYSVREVITIGRKIEAARAELFHAPHYVVPFTSAPTVVTIHDLIHLHQPLRNPLGRPYARLMIGRAVRRSRRILAVSETVGRELAEAYPAAAGRITVTPNGVDAALLNALPAADDESLVRRGLSRRRYLLYVGNDKPHKNVEVLIAAWREVRSRHPRISLVLVGGSFRRFAGEERVVRTAFLPLEDLAAFYRGAFAVVVPSLEEGFGLPAAEGMAIGVPVITSDAAALMETTGEGALHFPARDPAALGRAIDSLFADDRLRRALVERGRARAGEFSWQRCAQLTLAAYEAAHSA